MSRYLENVRGASRSSPKLTLAELFVDCNRLGLALQRDGDSIRFAGELTAVTSDLQAALDHYQPELRAAITGPSRPSKSSLESSSDEYVARDKTGGTAAPQEPIPPVEKVESKARSGVPDPFATKEFVLGDPLDTSVEDEPWQPL